MSLKPLSVKSRYGDYSIYIHTCHLIEHFQNLLHQHPQSQFGVITDDHLYNSYRNTIHPLLKKHRRVHLLTIPAGEKSKSIRTKMHLEKELFSRGFDRSSILIAWGGGVIGDLVGYVAATYMRGIPYYAFPTSVIAMVDSSVGGKTGIDTPYGKNLIGLIYPPKGVFIDVGLLHTLPHKEFINGCAEIAKYHFIRSRTLGEIIGKSGKVLQPPINPLNNPTQESLLLTLIEESLKVKVEVVNQDEGELGLRRVLNFGHTFGHALEHISRYRIAHGFAIAIGMGVEAFWALRKKSISLKHFKEILSLLSLLKLPVTLPAAYDTVSAYRELYRIGLSDKKSQNRNLYFVCLQDKGKWKVKSNDKQYREPITEKEFIASLKIYNRSVGQQTKD